MNRTVATVAVENTFFSAGADYDYYVPSDFEKIIKVGMRVKIPFGSGNRLREGIVVKLYTAINSSLKELDSIIGDTPALSEEAVALALWLKERCFCTTYDCLRQMLPRGYGKIGAASTRYARLLAQCEEDLPKLTPKQKSVVNLLFDIGSASVSEICEFCSVGAAVVKNLEKYGVLEIFDKEVYRTPYKPEAEPDTREIMLSPSQQKAYDAYCAMLENGGGTGLLYGVTGSGKTQVYMKLIDAVLAMGRDVIVLVPEISLTPQTLGLFHARYGDKVAVMHSSLSLGERNDEYKRADRGEAKIVVGTRSAVFAPLHNLGMIVIDEEQEHTYKSERTPKYDAVEAARFRCGYNKALLLLTSATPRIASYSNALRGKYKLCELDERYGGANLPQVIKVDMKQEMKRGNLSPISCELRAMLAETLENKMQAILLINRRGYNTFIACNDCGHVLTCPNCSISLTYHSYGNVLSCHYCGYAKRLDNTCPECGGENIRYSGYGTQRIEDEVGALFPEARILRMDADTTSSRFSHDRLFADFAQHKYDILIGTQMVAKGLDFPDVDLVGVVNADNSLYNENFNSSERCFDLITQVVGRCGRRDKTGRAVIQTVNPDNEIIEYASMQDYKSFYENEIELRRMMIYPPYCDIFSVLFSGEKENSVALCAGEFFETLKNINSQRREKIIILGPAPAKISKINNCYRYRIFVKCKNSKNIRTMFNDVLKNISKIKDYRDVSVSFDMNPNDMN